MQELAKFIGIHGRSALLAAFPMALSLVAQAQTPPAAIGRLGAPPADIVPQGSPLPGIEQNVPPPVGPSAWQPLAVPGTVVQAAPLIITSVTVTGATAYAPASLQAMVANLTGPAIPPASVEAARTAILNRYRKDGYVYTTVNAHIHAGALSFVVTEGRVVDVKLDRDIGPAGVQILRFLRHLTTEQPVNVAQLERWLLLAGDIPGITITSELDPSTEDPGALTLIAHVQRTPVSGQISADNRAFRQTGPEEMLALVDFNSFTSFGERTELSIFHTFNDTETFGQASEEYFLGGSGLKMRIYGGAGETVPSGSLRAIGYDGITRVGGVEIAYPVIRSRMQTLNVTAVLDVVESEIFLSANATNTPVRSSFDSLRILRWEADYTRLDTVLGEAFPATDSGSLWVSKGIPIFGASRFGEPDAPRVDENPDFTKVWGTATRTQTLFTAWTGATVSLKGSVVGQYSGDILPPAEKFYLGGPHFSSGFYYGQVTADSGLQTSIQPLLDTTLPKPKFLPVPLSAEFYGFYDWGEGYSNVRQDQEHVLRSIGGGVRLFAGNAAEIDLEGVSRLTRDPSGGGPNTSRLPAAAFYWQALARF